MKFYSLPRGILRETTAEIKQNFDLKKWLKKMFNLLNVPYSDPCCDTEANEVPVRFNIEEGSFERIDPADGSWDNVVLELGSVEDLQVDTISEKTAGANITAEKNIIQRRDSAAINVSATATAAEIAGGLITSTSAAAVALTLPLATDLATAITAVQGTSVDFMLDNSAGANTVTVTVNTGITAVTAVITGSATLTVASGVVGTFRIFFTSATVAKIARLI